MDALFLLQIPVLPGFIQNCPELSAVSAYRVAENGILGYNGLIEYNGVRPVFYLTNEIELTGEGTKENPFIIPNL